MTREEIAAVIGKVPQLTDHGIGIVPNPKLSPAEYQHELEEEQAVLLESAPICTKICDWLATKPVQETINPRQTSHDMKQIAGRDIGEVTNGEFIAAAIHLGLKFEIIEGSANVLFNLAPLADHG